jgi:hypothetical protein
MYIQIMQRPPQLPSTLFARQAYQWINRVNQKFNALARLKLSEEKKQRLKEWFEAEFVYFTLLFESQQVNRVLIMQIIQTSSDVQESDEGGVVKELLHSLRTVENVIESKGDNAKLNVELLLSLSSNGEFRKTNISTPAVRAEHLPLIVENACRWFAMDSFAELNPVEQAAIALLRLVELVPFEQNNQRNSLIAASLFTLRKGLPPIIVRPEQQEAYLAAVNEGLRMNTQPMVELVAQAIEQTLDAGIQIISASK